MKMRGSRSGHTGLSLRTQVSSVRGGTLISMNAAQILNDVKISSGKGLVSF